MPLGCLLSHGKRLNAFFLRNFLGIDFRFVCDSLRSEEGLYWELFRSRPDDIEGGALIKLRRVASNERNATVAESKKTLF